VTSATARTTANVVLASAGVAAAVAILATPPLRRLALLGLRIWLGTTVPAYLLAQTSKAWVESGRRA
jgi:hypothetical protein